MLQSVTDERLLMSPTLENEVNRSFTDVNRDSKDGIERDQHPLNTKKKKRNKRNLKRKFRIRFDNESIGWSIAKKARTPFLKSGI